MTAAAAEDASRRPGTHAAIHHSVVLVRDLEVSLRFYRDGIGLDLVQDHRVEGGWPGLFDAPSRGLRDPDGLLVLLTPGSITRPGPG